MEARDRTLREIEGLFRRYEAADGYARTKLGELISLRAEAGDYTAAVLTHIAIPESQANVD